MIYTFRSNTSLRMVSKLLPNEHHHLHNHLKTKVVIG